MPAANTATNPLYRGIEIIWFDLDDTLYDFTASSIRSLNQLYNQYSLDNYFNTPDNWLDIYHTHNRRLWSLYNIGAIDSPTLRHDRFYLPLVQSGVLPDEAERLTSIFDTLYLSLLAETGLTISGAHTLLRALRAKGFKIGILSNGFADVQPAKLQSSGLQPLVDYVVLSDHIGINKPDRRLFDHAATIAGVLPEHCIMIGDNPDTDITGAIGAGWRARLFDPKVDSLLDFMP